MPRPREDDDLQKHTIQLFAGDFQRVQDFYPDIGASAIIRRLVRKHIETLLPKPKELKTGEIDL